MLIELRDIQDRLLISYDTTHSNAGCLTAVFAGIEENLNRPYLTRVATEVLDTLLQHDEMPEFEVFSVVFRLVSLGALLQHGEMPEAEIIKLSKLSRIRRYLANRGDHRLRVHEVSFFGRSQLHLWGPRDLVTHTRIFLDAIYSSTITMPELSGLLHRGTLRPGDFIVDGISVGSEEILAAVNQYLCYQALLGLREGDSIYFNILRRNTPVVQPSPARSSVNNVIDSADCQSSRQFGIEFEFEGFYSQAHYAQALSRVFSRLGVAFENGPYRHSDGYTWDLKTDSSCGLELCTPALTWNRWSEVEAALQVLQANDAIISRSCGLHVHHKCEDLRATGLRRLVLLWMTYEKIVLALVESGRKDNQYCRTLNEYYGSWKDTQNALIPIRNMESEAANLGKYRALNISGWWRHGRIEVRIHHGTLDANITKFWTLLTQRMVELAKSSRDYKEMEQVYSMNFKDALTQFHKVLDMPKLSQVVNESILFHNPAMLAPNV